jgi:ATP-binding cassette subfamily B protein
MKTLHLLRRLYAFLSPRRKWQIFLVSLLMLSGTFLEVLTLGAVLPFLTVLTKPQAALRNPYVARIAEILGVTPDNILKHVTLAFIGVVLTATIVRLTLLWATHRLASVMGTDLSSEVYRRTLYQPFSVHASRNSSHLIATITKKVSHTTHVFQVLLTALTAAILAIGITTALVLINPVIAGLAALVFGGGYALIGRLARRRLLQNSKRIKDNSIRLVKALQEGLGGIRDVLLDATQPVHLAAYRRVDRPLRRATADVGFIAGSPRLVMEALGISCIAGLAYAFTQRHEAGDGFLPTLGALAIGAQRLLPTFQHMFAGYATIVGHHASLEELIALLEQPIPADADEPPPPPLDFRREIHYQQVCFRYGATGPWVLDGFDLVIPKGARVGFVGKTGGGKSTALDLLMGLLTPTSGLITVDGQPISGPHKRAWQRTIAHVPQSIFLSDASIAENIAFGVPSHKIDMERVRHVARIAHIADFVESQPRQYKTEVGERGVRLSGGQRQRMGIARALYKQASVLVFDEATSALDNATERELMDDIERLSRDLTILMIAHRLTTVERCDKIVVIEGGRIVAVDTHANLLATSEHFRTLTG